MSKNTGLVPVNTQELAEDASNRAKRTLWQGLAFDVLLAVALVVFNVFNSAEGWDDLDWKLIGFSLIKTVFITAASFIMRRFLDMSKVPTPLPPAPVPAPNEDAPVVTQPDAPVEPNNGGDPGGLFPPDEPVGYDEDGDPIGQEPPESLSLTMPDILKVGQVGYDGTLDPELDVPSADSGEVEMYFAPEGPTARSFGKSPLTQRQEGVEMPYETAERNMDDKAGE